MEAITASRGDADAQLRVRGALNDMVNRTGSGGSHIGRWLA